MTSVAKLEVECDSSSAVASIDQITEALSRMDAVLDRIASRKDVKITVNVAGAVATCEVVPFTKKG